MQFSYDVLILCVHVLQIAPIASSSHHGPKECDSGVGKYWE